MMLLQTNSYIVPKNKRGEHARMMARFRRCFTRLGSAFEVYEQVGPNFAGDGGGRFVQIMRFRDRKHQQDVHERERGDAAAQTLIADFCRLVNLPYQQQQGLFATSFYSGVLHEPVAGDAADEEAQDAPDGPEPVDSPSGEVEAEPVEGDNHADGAGDSPQFLGEIVDEADSESAGDDDDFDLLLDDDESAEPDEVDFTAPQR